MPRALPATETRLESFPAEHWSARLDALQANFDALGLCPRRPPPPPSTVRVDQKVRCSTDLGDAVSASRLRFLDESLVPSSASDADSLSIVC